MTTVMVVLGVLVLGAIGAGIRLGLAEFGNRSVGGWPWGTFSANIAAAFLLGTVHGRFGDVGTAVGVGLLGALSTWSTLALEIMDRIRSGRWNTAAAYLTTSVVVGVAAAWLGLQV